MAAPLSFVYAKAVIHLDDDVDWVADTIKVTLHSSSYTPNQSTDEFFNTVSASELATANGYTAGGATLTGKSRTTSSLATAYKASATTWTPGAGQTLAARYAIIRKDTGTASTSPLLGYVLLDSAPADVSSTNANFTITWNASNGALLVTAQ